MTIERRIFFWLAVLAGLLLFLYIFSEILLPFVAGFAIAYLLDPVADRLERMGLGRTMATIVILVLFVLVILLVIVAVAPLLADQLGSLAKRLPEALQRLQRLVMGPGQEWLQRLTGGRVPDVQSSVGQFASEAVSWFGTVLQQLWAGGQAFVSVLSLLVVTPVVAFYMLVDWDHMVGKVDGWVPPRHRQTVRSLAREINGAVAGFVRGQATVCLALGLYYGIGLSLVGLEFGLLIGISAGIISFIPYVGSLVGLIVSTGVAVGQFWPDWVMVVVVLAIFFSGQFIEGNILSPKLVGSSVGLHPVWLMFALVAFGYLFGFAGLLMAVPLAAIIGVLARFAVGQYLNSAIYAGPPAPPRSDV